MRILMMAGGTGGHIFPALAVANVLRSKRVEVIWLGTHRGLEAKLIPKAGYPIEWISVNGLRGKGIITWLTAPIKLLIALFQALKILHKQKPSAVLGWGGFVSGPGGLGAWLLKIPLITHEQNAIPGTTNRILAHLSNQILEGFPNTFSKTLNGKWIGNPVRAEIESVNYIKKNTIRDKHAPIHLLVLGGSQGAQILNKVLPQTLSYLELNEFPKIWHQCGADREEEVITAYQAFRVDAKAVAFIDEISDAYIWADIVLCRAGASTIAELMAVGIASLLVPYPFATDNHQLANAQYLTNHDAALLLPEKELTPQKLAETLRYFNTHRDLLDTMAAAAHKLHLGNTAQRIAEECLQIACN
ncbi:N-acetylglucosaminyl transferase [Candidatus Nitrosacidococcus tergens]|uniref:UDP-N-acetylglucosamine--N-acetylmuramyl-(pentapeptide) pyrophosphoryl-undecaprenol N-acetylglucosamine transferase n=2 Tax=Candidatus Nitrosacidococcus tergens TaxID=553981 RepID=A0A7G1QAU7_9GAMM|nr:undecaprenyldiphospho-muramoylpentapeptide beta-N-acetylglucosaminyltransferase [Candidatus Nitrosacidococcus tergens]CAB1276933.1 N-acetylglucosaminyl transferase [Candidatus Nitrosacidococcus tergens]